MHVIDEVTGGGKKLNCMQARLAKVFPSKYWMTMLTCVVGSLESLVVGMCISHDHAEWALKWDMQLLTVVYSVSNNN